MWIDKLGMIAPDLRDPAGRLLHVPHRLASHGMLLHDPYDEVVLLSMPVCALEDRKFGLWLSQRGIYRIEDHTGAMARIGEGRVIDRVRQHRASPPLTPVWLVAAFSSVAEWTYAERRHLEEGWSNRWVADGQGLVSRTFTRRPLLRDREHVGRMTTTLDSIARLTEIASRVLDNDADEFVEPRLGARLNWPTPHASLNEGLRLVTEVQFDPWKPAANPTTFEVGSTLTFADGLIAATATARRNSLVLHAGSSVYLHTSRSVGRRFASHHRRFLTAAEVRTVGDIGTTGVPVVSSSAAFLLKLTTAGRAHGSARWRVH